MSEFNYEQCLNLLRQLDECGVQSITLTGGEPMLHPNFMEVCREIERRGLTISELTTNGSFITPEMLDEFEKYKSKPLFKISLDGLGHHDWFREKQGSEKEVLDKITLLRNKGFRVRIQTNVHRGNIETILPTILIADKMGVEEIRIMRTSESPRWEELSGELTLSVEEYYNFALDLTRALLIEDIKIYIDIWQVLRIWPNTKTYSHVPVQGGVNKYRDNLPVCRDSRGQIAITPDGDVVPCILMSGWFKKLGISMGNVHKTPLRELLTNSEYLDTICHTVGEIRDKNPNCQACEYWKLCLGGCRLIGMIYGGSYESYDPAKCINFYKYMEKFTSIFTNEWHCANDLVIV